MDTNVNIDRITADLEKKYTGEPNHDVRVIQEYCRTLPPCEASQRLIEALGQYAAKKFPDADSFKFARELEKTIKELEKEFTGDGNHDVKVIQEYCKSLPKSEENLKIVLALGQYAAAKYPDADEIKRSKAEFDKMQEDAAKLKARLDNVQEVIKAKDFDKAISELQAIIGEAKLPEDDAQRLVSFSLPIEEVLFSVLVKETRPVIRISNLMEMLNLQLGGLLVETKRYDEARVALNNVIKFNPVSAPAHLELVHCALSEKKYDEAFELLQKTHPLIFSRQLLAVYFCELAEVVENLDKNYPLAAAFAHLSIQYTDNPPSHAILDRIVKDHHVDAEKPSDEKIRKMASDANLPVGPNPMVAEVAAKAAKQIKTANPEIANQLMGIASELGGKV